MNYTQVVEISTKQLLTAINTISPALQEHVATERYLRFITDDDNRVHLIATGHRTVARAALLAGISNNSMPATQPQKKKPDDDNEKWRVPFLKPSDLSKAIKRLGRDTVYLRYVDNPKPDDEHQTICLEIAANLEGTNKLLIDAHLAPERTIYNERDEEMKLLLETSTSNLSRYIVNTLYAAAADSHRQAINTLLFHKPDPKELNGEGKPRYTGFEPLGLVATDGSRMAYTRTQLPIQQPLKVLLHRTSGDVLLKTLKKYPDTIVRMYISNDDAERLRFTVDGFTIDGETMKDTFPDYEILIKDDADKYAALDVSVEAVKKALDIFGDVPVQIHYADSPMRFCSQDGKIETQAAGKFREPRPAPPAIRPPDSLADKPAAPAAPAETASPNGYLFLGSNMLRDYFQTATGNIHLYWDKEDGMITMSDSLGETIYVQMPIRT